MVKPGVNVMDLVFYFTKLLLEIIWPILLRFILDDLLYHLVQSVDQDDVSFEEFLVLKK